MAGQNIKTAFPVFNGYAPKQGPKAVPLTFDFTSVSSIRTDMLLEETQGVIQFVQAMWVDNYNNPNPLIFLFQGTNQRIVVPANAQGAWPVISTDQTVFTVSTTPGVIVSVILMNVPMASEQFGPVQVTANVTTAPYQATPANSFNNTVASAGTPIFAANAARHGLSFVSDPNNIDPIRITVGGIAFLTLLPGQDWQSDASVPMGAIAALSLNAGTTPTLQAIEFI